MKRSILILIIILVLFSNCTTVHNINQNPDSFYDEFNKTAEGRKGIILLINNQRYIGYDIRISQDSIFWIEKLPGGEGNGHKTFIKHSASTSNIKKIVVKNIGKGIMQGMGIGGLSGVLGAYLTSVFMYIGNITDSPDESGTRLAIYTGSAGLILGAIIGAPAGCKEQFVFNKEGMTSAQTKK